jgi:hypothetical protein
VELLQDHVLGGHRVALDGAGAARAGKVHRGTREGPADAGQLDETVEEIADRLPVQLEAEPVRP